MKKMLYILSFLALGGLMQQTNAQCALANPAVKLNYSYTENGNCIIGIDLYFDMKHNPGGKFVWVHIWPTSAYSNWGYIDPPTRANGGLTGSIATVGLEHQQSHLQVQSAYPPDPTLPTFQYTGVTASEGPSVLADYELYAIKNLRLVIPGGCDVPLPFTFDVWQSQSASAQNVHCFMTGGQFFANDPRVTGLMYCLNPRKYSFAINSIMTSGSMNVDYKVFIDDGDGIFNKVNDNIMVNSGSATLNSANSYTFNSGQLEYNPYGGGVPYNFRDLWVEVTSPSIPNAIYAHIINTCIPLPVKLAAFTAQRKNDRVQLNWTTASEINNRGFHIMRQNGNNGWQVMGFVSSATINGNSEAAIQYTFTDVNNVDGVTQYRLQQVDLDNKITYSDIRLVKGISQDGKLLVYPNPTMNGQVYVVLENMGENINIRLTDMNGRLVKEWNNLTNGRLTINNLSSGMYTLRVWQKNTDEVMNVKVIVSK